MVELRQPRSEPPRIAQGTAATFIGVSARLSLVGMKEIPAFWQRFMAVYPQIDQKLDPIPVGIVGQIDDDGSFDYACAVAVRPGSDCPKGCVVLKTAARTYGVFQHRGHVSALGGTYHSIWNNGLCGSGWTMADAPTLERHGPCFDTLTGEGGVSIWVPVICASA